jgi:hypothetical protein
MHSVATAHRLLTDTASSRDASHAKRTWPFGMRAIESFAAGICALACVSAVHAGDAVHAMPADEFLQTLAVDTHVSYTDGAYVNVHNVADDMAWLGIHHVRDYPPGSSIPFSSYVYLAQRGVKFNFLMGADFEKHIGQVAQLNTEVPGSVAAIEGPNELNNFPVAYQGLTGAAAGLAVQRDLYARVHAMPELKAVPVYDATGFDPKSVETRAASADFANQHVYPQNGEQPLWNANGDKWMLAAIHLGQRYQLPLVITEFGYFSLPQAGWYMLGVDEDTQAKGVLNGYMDAASAGVKRLYVYELLDEKPDPSHKNDEMHYGLFRNDNSPKPVAYAIRNLTSFLNANTTRRASAATRNTLAYTLSDMPQSANSLLLQKKDGRFVLVLWNETLIWDRATAKPLTSPPAHVGLDFGETAKRVEIYDPLAPAAEPHKIHRDVRQLTVEIPDHVILLEITPANAPGT